MPCGGRGGGGQAPCGGLVLIAGVSLVCPVACERRTRLAREIQNGRAALGILVLEDAHDDLLGDTLVWLPWDKAAPCGAAGPASASGSALGGRPAHPGPHGRALRSSRRSRHGARGSAQPSSSRPIVPVAATASMAALRAVARDRLRRPLAPRHSPGVGSYEEDGSRPGSDPVRFTVAGAGLGAPGRPGQDQRDGHGHRQGEEEEQRSDAQKALRTEAHRQTNRPALPWLDVHRGPSERGARGGPDPGRPPSAPRA